MDLYPRIISFVREQPWALMPEKHAILLDLLRFRNAGGRLTQEEISARVGVKAERAAERRYDPDTDEFYSPAHDGETGKFLGYHSETSGARLNAKDGVVAILGIIGLISQRAAQVDDMSGPGGTSIERLTARFRAARDDAGVKAIAFDVDSPGGGVYGVQELADEIRAARQAKPIEANANSLAASAAFWLAAAAGGFSSTPSGEVGSIGVYGAHEDLSKMLEQDGIKVTLISAGKFKTEGNPFEPLSEEGLAYWQSRVDEYYDAFKKASAKSRGVSVSEVEKKFGQGRLLGAKAALEAGMIDRIETLDQTVRRLGGRGSAKPTSSATTSSPASFAAANDAEATRARMRVRKTS